MAAAARVTRSRGSKLDLVSNETPIQYGEFSHSAPTAGIMYYYYDIFVDEGCLHEEQTQCSVCVGGGYCCYTWNILMYFPSLFGLFLTGVMCDLLL